MIARAASAPFDGDSFDAASAMPRSTLSIGSLTPMTPVEATSTAEGSQPIAVAVRAAISWAWAHPSVPVHALAQPLLITTARP